MLKSIKFKVFFNVFLTLLLLIVVIFCFNFILYQKSKKIILDSFNRYTSIEAENINKKIMAIEDNALDLAIFGRVYYEIKQKREFLEKFVIKVFENYSESLGGGIWFEPYSINPNECFHNIYAYRNHQDKIVIDKQFETKEYNYHNQKWYKEIMSQLKAGKKTAWSSPYFEKVGSNSLMVTAGAGIYKNNKLIGMSTVDWEIGSILKSVLAIKPTNNSFVLFADRNNDYILVSTDKYLNNNELIGKSVSNIPWYNDNLINLTYFTYHNTKYIPYVKHLDNGMILIINIPKWELFRLIAMTALGILLILVVFCFIIFGILYKLMHNDILRPIDKLEKAATAISNGKIDTNIVIAKPTEFAHLASTFTKMAKDIKDITYKQTRMEFDLSIAKSIQASSLPNIFPPFPDRRDFDIYATMTPAKEVGGDFYDFYFIDNNKFMFLIADVSGKGVPAALFMMNAKTLISNMAQFKITPKEMIELTNKKICTNNKEFFFITMFACIVNLDTGDMSCINCGHNPPLIYRSGNNYEYLKIGQNIAMGVQPNADYKIYETKLNAGDRIFLYTDGITEAINADEEMYGEERLLNYLNELKNKDITTITKNVKANVDDFSSDAEQSDDITMLLFEYNGNVKTYRHKAAIENYNDFYSWLNSICNEWQLDEKLRNKIEICAEEIFANICFYAYSDEKGEIEVNINKMEDTIKIQFVDEGKQYNPLEKPDPDITLSLEERKPGGLGIYMVKQIAKKSEYEYKDGKNIFTIFI
ncbi:SpoIIE family protein phosphatase [bacterium]|nr:SpoIIE family protein phosphatase [bacterium]